MNLSLILSVLLELLDVATRFSDKPEDIERYIELREQVRRELVAAANAPAGTRPPATTGTADPSGEDAIETGPGART